MTMQTNVLNMRRAYREFAENPQKSLNTIAGETGIPETSLRRYRRKFKNKTPVVGDLTFSPLQKESDIEEINSCKKRVKSLETQLSETIESLRLARSLSHKEYFPPPVIHKPKRAESTRVMIPDVHGSIMEKEAVSAMLADLAMLQPDKIIIMGDLMDCGGFLAQHLTMGYVAETEYTFEEDVIATNNFLNQLQSTCPKAKIYYLEGNHERRIEAWCVTNALKNSTDAKFLYDRFSPETILNLDERGIEYFRQSKHYMGIGIQGTIKLGTVSCPCYYTHGITACKHAAAKHVERFGGSVNYGHTHRRDSYTISTVAFPCIAGYSAGCLCKRQRRWKHTVPSSWQNGYGLETVMPSGKFQHLNVLITGGESLLMPMINQEISEDEIQHDIIEEKTDLE